MTTEKQLKLNLNYKGAMGITMSSETSGAALTTAPEETSFLAGAIEYARELIEMWIPEEAKDLVSGAFSEESLKTLQGQLVTITGDSVCINPMDLGFPLLKDQPKDIRHSLVCKDPSGKEFSLSFSLENQVVKGPVTILGRITSGERGAFVIGEAEVFHL